MKRVLAFLICLCMVLAMVPGNFAFVAKAAVNDKLVLDGENKAVCPGCGKTATWTPYSGSSRLGSFENSATAHYYLTGDVNVSCDSYLLRVRSSSTVCLHLNGHNITYDGYINVSGATLNVMGTGNVNFTGTAPTTGGYWKFGIYVQSSGKLNLLGGTYNLTETALENGVPMIDQTSGTTVIKDATVNGLTYIHGGSLTLSKTAKLELAQITNKLVVEEDWTGEAQAAFDAKLVDNLVPAANGVANGDFTGKLTMPGGIELKATAEGRLQAVGLNADLVLDENSQADCPVCQTPETWESLNVTGAPGQLNDGAHHHYYLEADLDASTIDSAFLTLLSNTKCCIHLNGFDLTYGSYMMVGEGATLNIVGMGNVVFTAATTGSESTKSGGIYTDDATAVVNLYGGTFSVAEVAAQEERPSVYLNNGQVNAQNVIIKGGVEVHGGTFALEEGAAVNAIQVAEAGKLYVKKNWTGSAAVSFAASIEDGTVPAANGAAEGVFAGTLKNVGGGTLVGTEEGVLLLDDPNNNLVFDENNKALCPHCNEMVTWTALTGNKNFNGGGNHHYYLTKSIDWAAGNTNFLRVYNGAVLCLHLNGFNLTHGSRIFVQTGSTISIMGRGDVTFTATGGNDDSKLAGIRSTGDVNLLGGTYGVAGNAATEGRAYISQTSSSLTVANAVLNGPNEFEGTAMTMTNTTVNGGFILNGGDATVSDSALKGTFTLNGGTMTVDGSTQFANLQVGTGGKLFVKSSWNGAATVAFAAALQDNVVPAANGEAEGSFAGKMKLSDGSTLLGFEDGSIRRVVRLELDANNMAVCPACGGDPVAWEAFSGSNRMGSFTGATKHVYLSADVEAAGITSSFIRATSGTSICLHLNDHNLTFGGYIDVSKSTLNIMGTGNVTYTGTAPANYDKFGLYIRSNSVVNLMGGAYSVANTALEAGVPLISQTTSTTTLGDVTLSGPVVIQSGSLILEKTASLDNLQMDGGKLTVAEGWAGKAEAKFPVDLVDNALPTANGVSGGSFVGGLVLEDGTILKGEAGKLVVNDYKALLVNEDQRGYCKVCNQMVTWKPIVNGGSMGTHSVVGGSHTHYYIAEDNITGKKAEFVYIKESNNVCLHLNNKSIKVPGRMRIFDGILNIMGDGLVDLIGTTTTAAYNENLLYCVGNPYHLARLNVYGGTFTSSIGAPILYGSGTYTTAMSLVNLYGNTCIDGVASIDQCRFFLHEGTTIEQIKASNTGSVRVDKSWYGTAKVSYLADMFEEYVNIFNGRSSGDFVGGLLMTDGRRLIGESGRLKIVSAMDLRLNAENQGYCLACHKVVDWTGVEGDQTLGNYSDGQHRHIYLSGDLDEQAATDFLHLAESSEVCLHLNGNDMTHGSALTVESGSSLVVLGEGKVTYAGISGQGGIVSAGTVKMLGGTWTAAEEKPVIYMTDGQFTVKDATVNSDNYLEKGILTLDGSATLKSIYIETAGLLSVEDSWTGEAAVEFSTGLTGTNAPSANISMKNATGKLTLLDGRELEVQKDGISVGNLKAPENLTYKLYDSYAEILSYSGEGEFLLPTHIAGKPITKIADNAFAGFTGTLYIGQGDTLGLAYAAEAGLTYTAIAAINGATGYTTVAAALNAFESGAVQLLTQAGDITVNQDTYLDLNGFDVANVTVTNGTLYVMDSQTDDFTVADGNYGKITGDVTGTVKAISADAACAEYGYMQVQLAEGISFHCIAMDIYAMTLRPDAAGVYYDCSFAGDEVVAPLVKSYGVALSVYGAPDETRRDWCYSEYKDFAAGKNDKGTLLTDVMQTGIADIKNQAQANMPIYGRAYIKTDNGYVFGQTICRDLQEQVELTDQNWEQQTKDLREKTRTMYETYQSVMADWDVSNVPNYQDRIWFTEPAPDTGDGWEQYSLPIGNGYLGTSVFGGTETETLALSDKTMYNPGSSATQDTAELPEGEEIMNDSAVGGNGFTNLCELHIDFGHDFSQVSNYQRDLLLDTAEARVFYDYQGVTYNRTYFANYPDNVTVAKLEASQKGKLTFTLRPEATYVRDYMWIKGDGLGRTGTVTASGDTSILAGTLAGYQLNYEAQFKVIPVGGTMTANADGTITVTNADSAVILISAGTNYELKPETMTAANDKKLDPNSYPHDKVSAVINAAAKKSYEELLETHLEDYQGIYGRVETDLGSEPSTSVPTDKQMQAYRAGDHSAYVEELLFKHGRYLLIASSRKGTLPANLQGMWQYYNAGAWRGGYVYNINLQMNYWSCYATNLLDMFECNFDYFDAMWDTLETNADNYLTGVKSPWKETTGTGANGIAIGASGTPFSTPGVSAKASAHSGPATTAYTTSLLWDYYEFTGDKKALEEKVWPYIEGCAIFLEKTLEEYDGKWLVSHSASPENNMWFEEDFNTVGTMFDQMFIYETFCQVKKAAEVLGYTAEEHPILTKIDEKIDKLDHVIVGKSGHIKEYREEEYYGEFGRYEHHGMAQLVGVYPATHVNSFTDAWQDAATVTATERGINYTGHQSSFKQLVWARLGNSDYAYLLAQDHITKYLRDNMWNTHTPFQIDGNFGYTAGVAEMLVQSHEGYISVLPALPEAWAATGSYSGLTARGGFEVGAAWKNGSATQIDITSNNGGDCSVKYFNISTAKVTDSKGNTVTFTVDGRDVITFATVAGETYTITALTEKVVVDAPADLKINGSKLTWEASPDAASYKVYRAVNSQATYELVAENVTETSYIYVPTDLKSGDQLILRVTAVNADGVESTGVRAITWDIVVNEQDALAMQAANTAYATYTGETTKNMLYAYEGRFVVLQSGEAANVYDSTDVALKELYDDPFTTENEAEKITLQQTTDGWYICDEGYSQHTYVAFGDSITYGIDGDFKSGEEGYNMEKPYPTLVAEQLGIGTVVNRAKSGATLCQHATRTNMTERILSYSGDADIISVMLGVNDYSAKCALGDMSSRDNTTIYGSLHMAAKHLTTNYPNAFIFFMTPFKYKTENNGVYNLADVAQAVKDVAAAYDIPVLDMYTNGQFDPATSAKDGIHPTQEHHKTYTAPMICELIEQNYDPKQKG